MRIVKLQAENIKRIQAVEIIPDGDMVVIAGKNGQGKTSVLDAIWFALGGKDAQRGTARPIRDGESSAGVMLNLGELVVTRMWQGDKQTLTVSSPEGAKFSSPQAMLDKLIGDLSFDPLAFSQQDDRAQLATLLRLVDLPFDVDDLARRRAALFAERTDVGREVKSYEAQLAAMPDVEAPDVEVSIADVLAELRVAEETTQSNDHSRAYLAERIHTRDESALDLRAAEDALEAARERLAADEAWVIRQQETVSALPTDPDTEAIRDRLANVETTNRAVRARAERERLAEMLTARRYHHDHQTQSLANLDEQKRAGIAAAKFPIDGLGFDDDGVTYNGVPFRQCSAAERLRVSVAMAMALNPKIRVIRIADGSLLDSENLALIEEMAGEQDFQIWLERVDESGDVGITIEDGRVAP